MWIVCAYYTPGYKKYVDRLKDSLVQFSIPHDITQVKDLGGWYVNMQYKPIFLGQMLEKHYPDSIVYIDVDAVFLRYPKLFDKLDSKPKVNIAVHALDHSKYRRKNHPPEMLSGTIFLRNSRETGIIIMKWIEACSKDPRLWDQVALNKVLQGHKYFPLPEEYVTIFDYMVDVKDPVIKHFQASREARRTARKNIMNKQKVLQERRVKDTTRIRRRNVHR